MLEVRAFGEGIMIDLVFCFGCTTLVTGIFSLFAPPTSLSLIDILLNSCLSDVPVDDRFIDEERELLLLLLLVFVMFSSETSCVAFPECWDAAEVEETLWVWFSLVFESRVNDDNIDHRFFDEEL